MFATQNAQNPLGHNPPQRAEVIHCFEVLGDRTEADKAAREFASIPLALDPCFANQLSRLSRDQPMPAMLVYLALWASFVEHLSTSEHVIIQMPGVGPGSPDQYLRLKPSGYATFRCLLDDLKQRFQTPRQGADDLTGNTNIGYSFPGVLNSSELSHCDLILELCRDLPGFAPVCRYNTACYTQTFAREIALRMQRLMANWSPMQAVTSLDPFLEGELEYVLYTLNDVQTPFPAQANLHSHIERLAQQCPQRVAVAYEDTQLTYAALNSSANRLAHHLIKERGIGLESVVALLTAPSCFTLIAQLACLKVGAVYLPIDPDYPEPRIQFMLEDARAQLILTTSALIHYYITDYPVLALDYDIDGLSESEMDLHLRVDAKNLAYINYTSGSTGQPKGVCISHQAVNRLVCATNFIQLNETDRVGQASNLAFDAATFEIWGPLTQGACLVGISRSILLKPQQLALYLLDKKINVLFLTTALVNTLSQTEPTALNGLRTLLFGGQAVDPRWIANLRLHGNRSEILHVYGPTESTTFATYCDVGEVTGKEHTLAIGGPLANTSLYVLDRHMNPVIANVPGELYIGGEGLARGYWQHSALTATRFVPHLFSQDQGRRLYRTGDKVRRNRTGDIEFMGRFDNQVKVRGFRIELGEVLASLVRLDQVVDAHILARELDPGQKDLVAFILPSDPDCQDEAALRKALSQSLPSHMIPSLFIFIEAMPLTLNGKVDAHALESLLDHPTASQKPQGDLAETPVERAICAAFAAELGQSQVHLDSNFFELGGDSLRAIRILARLQASMFHLSIEALFKHPTARALAKIWEQEAGTTMVRTEPFDLLLAKDRERLPAGLDDAFPASRLQLGMLYHAERSPGEYQDLLSYTLEAEWRVDILEDVIDELFTRHPMLRASFELEAFSEPLVLLHTRVVPSIAVTNLSDLPKQKQDQWLATWRAKEIVSPFKLGTPPLVRIFVQLLGENNWSFSLSLHHALVDGWSLAGLFSEIFQNYASRLKGVDLGLAPIRCAYRDYIALERAALQSPETQVFWRKLLTGAQASELPRSSELSQTKQQGIVQCSLDPALLKRLGLLARLAGCQLKQVLLAAHLRVIAFRSGSNDVMTGLVANGRPEQQDGDLVTGLFLNTLPFRLKLGQASYLALVREVAELETEMLKHRRFPLVDMPEGHDLFKHAFNYIDFHRLAAAKQLDNLILQGLSVSARSHFDLCTSTGPSETGSGFAIQLEFNRAVLSEKEAMAILADYTRALELMAHDPLGKPTPAQMMTGSEREQIMHFSFRASGLNLNRSVHSIISMRAEQEPDQEVLVYGERRYSRAQLEQASSLVARNLRAQGVRAGNHVALYMTASDEAVIALLAIWKAGAIQVPIDPNIPDSRLRHMLEDAQVSHIILNGSLSLPQTMPVITLNYLALSQPSDVCLVPCNCDPAYVMFTSGSTGRPKAVRVYHHNIVRLILAIEEVCPFADRRLLACAPLSFDASTFELWGALALGSCLAIYPGSVPNVSDLRTLIKTESIKWLWLTAGLFHSFIEDGSVFEGLDFLLSGGEKISPQHVLRLEQSERPPAFFNGYGPTEATGFTTLAQGPSLICQGRVSIGKPIADTAVYILDPVGALAPIATPGDLYIGGEGLAEGYLNSARATANSFRPNPFSGRHGDRMYLSGDVARWLPNGCLDLLGRRDKQIKLNGLRIELPEIEAALEAVEGVTRAIVLLTQATHKRLIAFYTGKPFDMADLRTRLSQSLPIAMVPGMFVHVARMPVTINGKVDTSALLTSLDAEPGRKCGRTHANPMEQLMLDLWSLVLKTSVALEDNFFSLGGNSIQATRLIAKARKLLNREIPLRLVFEHPTPTLFTHALHSMSELAPTPDFEQFKDGAPCLSFSQRRFWFLSTWADERGMSSVYNVPASYLIEGPLVEWALADALKDLIERHPMLRTCFPAIDGEPSAKILSYSAEPFSYLDLSHEQNPEAALSTLNQTQANQPYDLANGPLFRAQLVRIHDRKHALLLNLHHILVDGWALELLFEDLALLYRARCTNTCPTAYPAKISYPQFARWQASWMQTEAMTEQLSWWRQQLNDVPRVLDLPSDRPRSKEQSYRGDYLSFELDQQTAEQVRDLSVHLNVTPFITLLGVYQVVLSRLSGQNRFCLGIPIAGRDHEEWEQVIGCFINSLALPADLTGNPSFQDLLLRTRDMALACFARAAIPFEYLVEHMELSRDLSRSPLFQALFAFQNTPRDGNLKLDDLATHQIKLPSLPAKLDLSLTLVETKAGLSGTWVYNRDLFDRETVKCFADLFVQLLKRFIENPSSPVHTTPLYADSAKAALLETGKGRVTAPVTYDLIAKWEQLAKHNDTQEALCVQGITYTREQLNQQANRLAQLLIEKGVQLGTRVALCLEPSADLIIAILATLKCGAAYVPLDPNWPELHLSQVLQDCGAAWLISHDPVQAPVPNLSLRLFADRLEIYPSFNPPRRSHPLAPAYLIYTSGSSGRAKAVIVSLAAIANYTEAICSMLQLEPHHRLAMISTVAADLGHTMLFPSLFGGARLLLLTQDQARDPFAFASVMKQEKPDFLKIVPSHLLALIAATDNSEVLPSTALILGGEPCGHEALMRLRRQKPGLRIINHYGPTETTVGVLTGELDDQSRSGHNALPLTRPLPNCEAHVLARFGALAAPMAWGELYLGGAQLANGYHERPALTAAAFLPNPFSAEPGARLYRSGDRFKRSTEGSLTIHGRLDDQIKIRGFRVEPGEVSAALKRLDIMDAVCLAHEAELVAFITVKTASQFQPELFKLQLAALPDYMLPSTWVKVDCLPLTANGKLDRKKLLGMLPREKQAEKQVFVGPRNPLESVIALIWSQVFRLDRLSVHENFFALGGHSLLAIKISALLSKALNRQVTLHQLLIHPSVAELARNLQNLSQEQRISPVSFADTAQQGLIPLSHAQEQLWFHASYEQGGSTYNMPYLLCFQGQLHVQALDQAIAALCQRHQVLRTRIGSERGRPFAQIMPIKAEPLQVVQVAEREIKGLAQVESRHAFDLEQDSLFRTRLFRVTKDRHYLCLVFHHIIFDGISMDIFMAELLASYADFAGNKPLSLPALPMHYADYARWQSTSISEELQKQLTAWWRNHLQDASGLLHLRHDKPRPPVQSYVGAELRFDLDPQLSLSLWEMGKMRGMTPYMTLLALWQTLLHLYSGQTSFCVGSALAGRNYPELNGLLGCFANTLPMLADFSENPSFEKVLERTRQHVLDVFAHADLSFHRLVNALKPQRDPSYAPIYQVTFSYNQVPERVAAVGDLRVTREGTALDTAKFDLSLVLGQRLDALHGCLQYNTELFDADFAKTLVARLKRLAHRLAQRPDQAASACSLLSAEETRLQIEVWNARAENPILSTIQAKFERQAHLQPNRVATQFKGHSLTYGQLNEFANGLAHNLRQCGVARGSRVVICMDRCPELLVVFYAILKLGAVSVPVDPRHPAQRIHFIMKDAKPTLAVLQPRYEHLFDLHSSRFIIDALPERRLAANPNTPNCGLDPALLIYTSGSTGQPKGHLNTHSGISNFIESMGAFLNLGPNDRFLFKTTHSFDASVNETLLPLSFGALIEIAEPQGHLDPAYLVRTLRDQQITHVQFPPSMLQIFLDEIGAETLPSLNTIISSGEELTTHLRDRVFDILGVRLCNGYGPSECAVGTLHWFCRPEDGPGRIPIGLPVNHCQTYVLGPGMSLLPPGTPGELYLGGTPVGQGYFGQPGQTAARFVPNPFAKLAGERLYRSGDLVRYSDGQCLEYLSRIDHMLKLNGTRVEPGEISACIAAHPLVTRAHVMARVKTNGHRFILAWYTTHDANPLTETELRVHTTEHLPEFMVPNAFIHLVDFPISPNGKMDLAALPDPEVSISLVHLAPHTPTQQIIAEIFAELLDVEKPSITDSFFNLGGNSLIAMQVVSRLRERFAIEISVLDLFQLKTIEALADWVIQAELSRFDEADLIALLEDIGS